MDVMRFSRSRLCWTSVFVWVVLGALANPCAAYAGFGIPPSTIPTLSAPPSSTQCTVSSLSWFSIEEQWATEDWYLLPLVKGQTARVSIEADPSVYLDMMVQASISSQIVGYGRCVRFSAPRTGNYMVRIQQWNADDSTSATLTLDTQLVAPVRYRVASLKAPKSAKHAKPFWVTARLAPNSYDSFGMPLRFYFERKSHGKWKPFSSKAPWIDDNLDFHYSVGVRTKLPRGTFRVRCRFMDAAHPTPVYTSWRAMTVR